MPVLVLIANSPSNKSVCNGFIELMKKHKYYVMTGYMCVIMDDQSDEEYREICVEAFVTMYSNQFIGMNR